MLTFILCVFLFIFLSAIIGGIIEILKSDMKEIAEEKEKKKIVMFY